MIIYFLTVTYIDNTSDSFEMPLASAQDFLFDFYHKESQSFLIVQGAVLNKSQIRSLKIQQADYLKSSNCVLNLRNLGH
jgi:hypothetical protein